MSTLQQRYRVLRHEVRSYISFSTNYVYLKKLRHEIKKRAPERKIIVINLLEHIGDIVASEPISRYVRQRNPDACILWAVKNPYRELIDNNPHIDKALIVHCLSERIRLSESGLFDEIIDLHFHDRYCSLCRRPLRKTGTVGEITLGNYFNFGGILTALSLSSGLPALDGPPRVYIPEASVDFVDRLDLPTRFIVVNCASNAVEKDWPAAKWMELTEKIMGHFSTPVIEVGNSPLLSFFSGRPGYLSLCGRLSLLESAEVIRRASLFIGIDSGPAHLANAVGTYGIVLMGSYLGFEEYNPFSGGYRNNINAEIIRHNGCVADIPVRQVLQSVEKNSERIKKKMTNAV